MRALRIFSLLLAVPAGLLVFHFLAELYFIGFPDGHRTELGQLRKRLYPYGVALNIVVGVAFVAFSFLMPKQAGRRSFLVTLVVYALLTVLLFGTDYYFSLRLDNGQGG